MARHVDKKEIDTITIQTARQYSPEMIERLVTIARQDPATSMTIKAAEILIRIAREPLDSDVNDWLFETFD